MPSVSTARIGPMEHIATRPKLSSAAWRSLPDARNTHAQRHDKGHSHGAGGHAAGVKRHGKKLLGHKGRQQKDEPVEQHQQLWQRNADEHTQEGKDQKQAHARRHRKDQRAAGDGGHLICQHLQVRLGDGDKEAQQKSRARE